MLEISHIHAGYHGQADVVRGVNVAVQRGEIVAILGPNGAGKTTLLSTVVGVLRARQGTVSVDGRTLPAGQPRATIRAGVGFVPEGRRLFRKLSVRENLLIGSSVAARPSDARARLESVYSLFPVLYERRNQAAGTLSGGEAQMAAIGRALVGEPDYVLLDEPSFGLAPRIVERVAELLKQVAERVGILLVEQNAGIAIETSTRVLTMANGVIVDVVDPKDPGMRAAMLQAYFR
jgi:branched-chain amino acid transport system ATP-binding protein